jgi:AraC family transcriptional regulator
MAGEQIRIIILPTMKVASFYAFSASPETEAWEKTMIWAKAHGYWKEPPGVRIFGFNNPDPSEGSPNYGYEFWLTVGPEVQENDEIKIKQFTGGLYAVMRCDVSGNPEDFIPPAWSRLVKWRESSHYQFGNHQWLEEHLTRTDTNATAFVLDLYLPISE